MKNICCLFVYERIQAKILNRELFESWIGWPRACGPSPMQLLGKDISFMSVCTRRKHKVYVPSITDGSGICCSNTVETLKSFDWKDSYKNKFFGGNDSNEWYSLRTTLLLSFIVTALGTADSTLAFSNQIASSKCARFLTPHFVTNFFL